MLPEFRFAQLVWIVLLACALLAFNRGEEAQAEEGLASWYGPGFEEKTTASGEPYDPNDYTAAHKTLPLGTELIVTYEDRSVPVTVNDRGPYVGNRELDLSQAAARALGLIPDGVGLVEYEITDVPEPVPSRGATPPPDPQQRTAQQPGLPQGTTQQPAPAQVAAGQPNPTQGVAQQPDLSQESAAQQPSISQGRLPELTAQEAAQQPELSQGTAEQPAPSEDAIQQPGLTQGTTQEPASTQAGPDSPQGLTPQPGLTGAGEQQPGLSQKAAQEPGLVQPDPSQGVVQQPGLTQEAVQQPSPTQGAVVPEELGVTTPETVQQPELTQGAAQQPRFTQGAVQPDLPGGAPQRSDLSQGVVGQPDLPQEAAQQPVLPQEAAQQPVPVQAASDSQPASALDYPVGYPIAQGQADGGTYVVQPGDTLSEIADQVGVSPETLASYNGTTDPDLIYSGQPLYYPAGAGEYRTTGYTMIDNPLQLGGDTSASGEGVTGDGAYNAGGSTVPGFASGNAEFPGDVAPEGRRYLLPATGGGMEARS